MTLLLIQAASALVLILNSLTITARGAYFVATTQVLPLLLGVALSFFTLAQFMGWPV